MRARLLAYLAAACINLAIVSGTLPPSVIARVPIVRMRRHDGAAGVFAAGETAPDGRIAVSRRVAHAGSFSAN